MASSTLVRRGLLTVGVLLVAIQLVPYGRATYNPPVVSEPAWDSAETRDLARRACFDCHSHETRWPWYARIAPVSWLVQHDVDEGRHELNFSDWAHPGEEAGEAAESVAEGEMPPRPYLMLHGEARLTAGERQALMAGLQRTIGGREGGAREGDLSEGLRHHEEDNED
jgi:hypothetical protein